MLTTIQIPILKWLARYKYLNIHQIHRYFFEGKTKRNTEIALQKLDKLGFIHRMSFPRTNNFNFGIICYLSKKGHEVIEQESHFEEQVFLTQPVKKVISSINHYYHRSVLVQFFIALDLSLVQFPKLRLKKVLVESHQISLDGKKIVETNFMQGDIGVIADMAFTIENDQGKEVTFFTEIDCKREVIGGSMDRVPAASLVGKYLNYEKILQSDIWHERLSTKAQAFRVLTVTEDQRHLNTILKRSFKNLQFPQLFLGTTHEKVEQVNILTGTIWRGVEDPTQEVSLL